MNVCVHIYNNVRLEILYFMGRKVETLVGVRQSAGSQQAQFDPSNLSSGVYLYRLTAGQTIRTSSNSAC